MEDSFQLDIVNGCATFHRITDVSALSTNNLIAVIYVGEDECKLYYAEGEFTYEQSVEAYEQLVAGSGENFNWIARVKAPDEKQVELKADDVVVGSIFKDVGGNIIFEEFVKLPDGTPLADLIQATLDDGFAIGLNDREVEFVEIHDIMELQQDDFVGIQMPDDGQDDLEVRMFRSPGPSSEDECIRLTQMLNQLGVGVRVFMVQSASDNTVIIGMPSYRSLILRRDDDGSLIVIDPEQYGGSKACH